MPFLLLLWSYGRLGHSVTAGIHASLWEHCFDARFKKSSMMTSRVMCSCGGTTRQHIVPNPSACCIFNWLCDMQGTVDHSNRKRIENTYRATHKVVQAVVAPRTIKLLVFYCVVLWAVHQTQGQSAHCLY